jgi:hypothetical protein
MKYLNKVDDIIGISQMSEGDTIQFIKKNKLAGVSFIVDNGEFVDDKTARFEALIDNTEVTECRKDPTPLRLFLIYISLGIIIGSYCFSSQQLYTFIFKKCYII